MLCAGDDVTDEEMFAVLPDGSCSIKVGAGASIADYHVKESAAMLELLARF